MVSISLLTRCVCVWGAEEMKGYQEQLKQMLRDLAKEKEKTLEKPLPLMNQVAPSPPASGDTLTENPLSLLSPYFIQYASGFNPQTFSIPE